MSKTVALVGSTGSIGTQAIDVITAEPDRFRVIALGAATSIDVLGAQAHRLRPEAVAIADVDLVPKLEELVPPGTEVVGGSEALADVSRDAEVVLNAVVGFAGLPVTMAALEAGRRLALANKQSLIAAGPVVQQARATPGAEIVPVDSEHSAIHQCLRAGRLAEVRRIVLTASGGPFRGRRAEDLADVTVDEALAHPTWNMGPQNTIDSSTLMNKGLEVIAIGAARSVRRLAEQAHLLHPKQVALADPSGAEQLASLLPAGT
ncbi:MAG: 1-deoxy-D-xylulose-5-phosphate reductoisomerase, partial [Acidimicrobiia bacterium]|nr:1-deoxy-D-xylulose-5-phosphate reductoisomerase [Acidimicrobiia bacterium]